MGARLLKARRKAKRRAHRKSRLAEAAQAAQAVDDRQNGRITTRRAASGGR